MDYSQIPNPCFVLDERLLRRNLETIRYVKEQAGVDIIMAFKGFAMWQAFPIIKEYVQYATASSLNEARLAFEEMGTEAHTYAPAYTDEDFDDIIRYSSHITFNSLSQYERLMPRVRQSGKKISVGLRVNPEYSEATAELYNPCAVGSRLGIMAADLKEGLPEGIEGLHFHTLCEASSYSLEKTLFALEKRFGEHLRKIKWLNMGGGHLMTRKGYDLPHLITVLKQFKAEYNIDIILEPGSAFAWETGVLTSKVIDIVSSSGLQTALLNVSFTAHMPDCLEMPYKPHIQGASEPSALKPTYRMGGNSCLAGDYIDGWSFDKPLQIGDTIVFDDMIHYTMVKTTTFNGVQHPAIGIWTMDDKFRLLKAFTYDDYKNRLS